MEFRESLTERITKEHRPPLPTAEMTPAGVALIRRLLRDTTCPEIDLYLQTANDAPLDASKPAETAAKRGELDKKRIEAVEGVVMALRPGTKVRVTLIDPHEVGMAGVEAQAGFAAILRTPTAPVGGLTSDQILGVTIGSSTTPGGGGSPSPPPSPPPPDPSGPATGAADAAGGVRHEGEGAAEFRPRNPGAGAAGSTGRRPGRWPRPGPRAGTWCRAVVVRPLLRPAREEGPGRLQAVESPDPALLVEAEVGGEGGLDESVPQQVRPKKRAVDLGVRRGLVFRGRRGQRAVDPDRLGCGLARSSRSASAVAMWPGPGRSGRRCRRSIGRRLDVIRTSGRRNGAAIPSARRRAAGKDSGLTNRAERFDNATARESPRAKYLSFSENLVKHIGAIWYFVRDCNLSL